MDNAGVRAVGSPAGLTDPTLAPSFGAAPTGMRDLGTFPGGDYSEAFGVNDSGTVVGDSNTRDTMLAFVWNALDGMRELSPLPGDSASRALRSTTPGKSWDIQAGSMGFVP